jgi:acyl carrier protein
MSMTKKERQLAFELVCASDYKLAEKLRELFVDADRLDYLEKRTALSSSGLSINPNMFQKVPAKEFSFIWRFERTEPKPTLRAAIDNAAKYYPLVDVADWMGEESPDVNLANAAQMQMEKDICEIVSSAVSFTGTRIPVETTFEEMGADSVDMVDIILSLEHRFDIEIPDLDPESWRTTQDLINYVQRRTTAEVKK